jgi:D-alanyl-lipoteichoic acid acyltransferase DltB (MBOAT superfamily)
MGFIPFNGGMTERNDFSRDIWLFQDQLTRRLTWWSMGSILAGALMLLPEGFWRGMGVQFLAWGLIDLAIAFFGARSASKRKARLSPAELLATAPKERANLAKILWINTGLDVLYVAGGLALIVTQGNDPFWLGGGWGVVLQGGFLFLFDLFHALKLR